MADWSNIANATLEAGKPVRAIDLLALRDNPIAISEGRPGAPRLSPWADASPVVAGAAVRFKPGFVFTRTSTSFGIIQAVGLMNTGTVRIKATHARTAGTGQSRVKITRVRAGVETELVAETSDSPISYDADIEPGNTILWWHRCQDSGATCTMSGIELCTDGELLCPVAPYFTFGSEPT